MTDTIATPASTSALDDAVLSSTPAAAGGTRSIRRSTGAAAASVSARRTLPGVVAGARHRSSWELKAFFRSLPTVVFTLALPVLMLVIFGTIFTGTISGTDVDFKQYFVAGIIGAGVMSTAFTGLAIGVALERSNGLIRRLASAPMPKSSYFIGKVVLVLVTSTLETVILIGIGLGFYGLKLPSDPGRWLTFAWVLLLGTAACALFGLAWTALIPDAGSAAAIVTPPFLILQFISGVFYPFNMLPSWMQTIASFFPLKWMCQGLRYVFLPESFGAVEQGGSWNLPLVAAVLTAWAVGAALVTAATFRWRGPKVK